MTPSSSISHLTSVTSMYLSEPIAALSSRLSGGVWPFRFQSAVFWFLLLCSPIAMSFSPNSRIYTEGVWNAAIVSDRLFLVRAGLIIIGLLIAVLSVCLFALEIVKGNGNASRRLLQASMAVFTVQIGWVAFPYWSNGLFQVQIGNVPNGDFDPMALMPGVWLGDLWGLSAQLFYLLTLALVIALFLFTIGITFASKNWKRGVMTILCLGLTFSVFYLTTNLIEWLRD